MKFLNKFFLLSIVVFVLNIQASVYSVDTQDISNKKINTIIKKEYGNFYITINTYYRMGDSDSRASSREVALEMAKLESSSVAGSYIQSDLQMKNGKITLDEVRILTASVMSIKINEEKLFVDQGLIILHLNTTAIVDEKSLNKNIEAFKKSENKKKRLIELSRKNKKLIKDVQTLSAKLDKKAKIDFATIARKRKQLLDKINENTKSMKKVFKKGSLFEMANKFEQELEYHKETALYEYKKKILEETKVITKISKIMPNIKDKKLVDVIVKVSVVFPKSAQLTLMKYYEYTRNQSREYNWVNNVSNSKSGWKTPYSNNLAETFLGEDLKVKICLGRNCTKKIIIKSRGRIYANIFNIVNNPIIFSRISRDELNTIEQIESKVFWNKRISDDFQNDWKN